MISKKMTPIPIDYLPNNRLSLAWSPSHPSSSSGGQKSIHRSVYRSIIRSIENLVCANQTEHNTVAPQLRNATLPYELRVLILRFLRDEGHSSTVASVCRVNKSWYQAASDVLYERIEPRSYSSVELLLHSLTKHKHLRSRIRYLILPLISTFGVAPYGTHKINYSSNRNIWKECLYDTEGQSRLHDAHWIFSSNTDHDRLNKAFRRLINILPGIEGLHVPVYPEHPSSSTSLVPSASRSSLRSLVLLGTSAVIACIGSTRILGSFDNLESLSLFQFNASNISLPILSNNSETQLFPRLKSLHLERGVIPQHVFVELLRKIGPHLDHLVLRTISPESSEERSLFAFDEYDVPLFSQISRLALDLSTVRGECVDLAVFRNLKWLDVALHGANLSLEASPHWYESLPKTIRTLSFVDYNPVDQESTPEFLSKALASLALSTQDILPQLQLLSLRLFGSKPLYAEKIIFVP